MLSFFGLEKNENWELTTTKTLKTHCISIETYGTGPKLYNTSQSYLSIPLFYHMWGVIHTIACFRSSAPKKMKTENARHQSKKSHYISIKTYRTGTKLYNTSQSYLSIPLFYHMWGNTQYHVFVLRLRKNENRKRETPKQ